MSTRKRIANKKCSALLAAGTGAAVCLTGGGVHAVNGNISASNGANSTFATGASGSTLVNLFGSKATMFVDQLSSIPSAKFFTASGGFLAIRNNIGSAAWPASVTVGSTLGTATLFATVQNTIADKYLALSFVDTGTKYGWVHIVSCGNPSGLQIDLWSYNGAGGTIKTLSDSVTTSRLALSDGKVKLHWSNDNEDGVARYEVQSQDASGAWTAADSDVPGSGSYSAKVDSGRTCRLVVEMTDGSTKEIDF
jgi:hypothetical protein